MKIKFWGTRGSIPTPLPTHMKYGGDTSCVEVQTRSGERIIFDAGTGIRRLGNKLMANPGKEEITIFLSHTHWDHIQGFPFFLPIYNKNFKFKIYGPLRADQKMEMRLHVQMSDLFFPVNLKYLEETMEFIPIVEDPITIGDVTILPHALNHPMGSFGYRVTDSDGKVFVYATDNEHVPEGDSSEIERLVHDADALVWDSHFTDAEFPKFRGWGHSTWEEGCRVASTFNVKNLILFHHDPNKDDAQIDGIVEQAQKMFPGAIPAIRDFEFEI